MDKNIVLITNGYLSVPALKTARTDNVEAIGTILSNMAHYGFIPSQDAFRALQGLTAFELGEFWGEVKAALAEVSGANRNMDAFVVYRNFPAEVLEKSQAEYWFAQVLMYWGFPNGFFTQEAEEREPLKLSERNLKVLAPATFLTLNVIYQNLIEVRARWTDPQREQADFLFGELRPSVAVEEFGFRENGIAHAAMAFARDQGVSRIWISTATDVARLYAALSGGDVSLRQRVRFRALKRPERLAILRLLEACQNLDEDMARRPGQWKKIMHALRPRDYWRKVPKTYAAYDRLIRGAVKTFSARVERAILARDVTVLDLLSERPGEFVRRFHKLYGLFGAQTVDAFLGVLDRLSTSQLLKIDRYIRTINDRTHLVYPPRGNWAKAQVAENTKVKIETEDRARVRRAIVEIVRNRLAEKFPEGFDVSDEADNIRLQTNDQKLASYGRGTVFAIPENVRFIRSASYWAAPTNGYGNIWYDNGWNFFDSDWEAKGACCWNAERLGRGSETGAVFSGDPTNSNDLRGRACQMIDLYPEKLLALGVRYAVWNVLCYSRKSFDEAEEVLATLQWGEDPQAGKLYEPSRAQMIFPLRGENMTKYVAYIDLQERKLVYADANLRGHVESAARNGAILQEVFPPFVEYLKSLPTVADLFRAGKPGVLPVLYSDEGVTVEHERAYVFRRLNSANDFQNIDVASVLGE